MAVKRFVRGLLMLTLSWPIVAHADDATPALKAIGETADNLCGIMRTAGGTRSTKASGAVRASLSGLVKRLADLGLSIGGELEKTTYDNVAQNDLAPELKDARACRTHIFDVLQAKLLPVAPPKAEADTSASAPDTYSSLEQAPGRWIIEPSNSCTSSYYVWSILGDQSTFRDQLEQVDIEHITKVTDKQLTTVTVASIHIPSKGKSEQAGSTWQYTFTDNSHVAVRNLSDGRTFTLKRCKAVV